MNGIIRKLAGVLIIGVVLWFLGSGEDASTRLVSGVDVALEFFVSHPGMSRALVVGALVWFLIDQGRNLIPRHYNKDPKRGYDATQRKECASRAGNRCEMDGLFYTRCRRPAQHADHWIPHSKGGATSLENAVAACRTCNLSKSAWMPGMFATQRIAWRRRRYFPEDVNRVPGQVWSGR